MKGELCAVSKRLVSTLSTRPEYPLLFFAELPVVGVEDIISKINGRCHLYGVGGAQEVQVSRRTVARDLDFLHDEERAPLAYDDARHPPSPAATAWQAGFT